MSDVYQCTQCQPACILVAEDDDMPRICPFAGTNPEKANIPAEWRQIG